jgi:hypothetical protein
MQRFLDGPQGVLAARRFHQDETVWIKPKRANAVAGQAAVTAKPISRDDEEERVNARKTSQQRHHKTKGGRQSVVLFGDDLMQRAAGKAALGQIAIDGGKAEGNWRCLPNPFHFRQ